MELWNPLISSLTVFESILVVAQMKKVTIFFKISSSKYIHVYIYLIYNFRMSLKGNCFNTRLKDYVQTLCFGSR